LDAEKIVSNSETANFQKDPEDQRIVRSRTYGYVAQAILKIDAEIA